MPFAPTVTSPVKVLVTAALAIVNVPADAPFPIVVAPFTTNAVVNAFNVKVPCVIVKFPLTVVVPVPVIVAPLASSNSRFPKVLVAPLIT